MTWYIFRQPKAESFRIIVTSLLHFRPYEILETRIFFLPTGKKTFSSRENIISQ